MKPIIRWVGGKRNMLHHYKNLGWEPKNRIVEPFCGGAAISLDSNIPALNNDSNPYLINFYNTVKKFTDNDIQEFIEWFFSHSFTKEEFYDYRSKQNELTTNLDKAKWFFYINRCGFNGLWRVNKKGKVNTPYGRPLDGWGIGFKDITFEHFQEIRDRLQNVEIRNENAISIIKNYLNEGDWVFIDPPYDSTESNYTQEGWNQKDLQRLNEAVNSIDKEVVLYICNSDTEFVRKTFNNIAPLELNRRGVVNQDSEKRGKVKELLYIAK
ncbi:DNA adenine methylase [Bacillus sp. T33-2]|uniref:DNA adenine methylase n=1 Tax=Bacillus sp. T33-2 TaxID=2054168 RepID=UPI000C75FBAA|nr:Dam family site-specific DNA-(adenine-N6)-methyltransferase [Bacillus sp. T33-2]PLR99502.1 hypothetical protein CVD19_00125 [Bacillus sp. T33-2]